MNGKILVVDDSTIVRQVVAAALTPAGYEIIEAVDGTHALEKLDATPDICMILCDINMPRMNGLEFLEKLKETSRIDLCPIVMLTTEGHPELIARAKALGAKAWMVKPVVDSLLVATVKKLSHT